jgi:hypothetical protein
MDVENEIGALKTQFIVKIDSELDADHLFPESDDHPVSGDPEALGRAMKQRFATGNGNFGVPEIVD